MSVNVVEVDAVSHRYVKHWALEDVSLRIASKGVIGLLGSNGAGKSTLMNILCGCTSQSQGQVTIAGMDVRQQPEAARRLIGFLPQQAPLALELSVDEYFRYCAGLRRMSPDSMDDAVDYVVDRCGLKPMRSRLIGALSGGYRQRVGIAQALVHRPKLIVLDEPTVGLDPNQILGVRSLIRDIGEEHTILFSTHIMPEIEALCRRVVMIEQGRLCFDGDLQEFRSFAPVQSVILACRKAPSSDELLQLRIGIEAVNELSPGRLRLKTNGDKGITERMLALPASAGWGVQEIYYEHASLEDVFQALAQKVAS